MSTTWQVVMIVCLFVFFVYVCSFFCQAFSNLLSMGLYDMCVVSSMARHHQTLAVCVSVHLCPTLLHYCQRWDSTAMAPLVHYLLPKMGLSSCVPIGAVLPKMGFSGCGPTIAALLPKMRFSCCVTHIAELLPKMGFSGLSPWLHLDWQRWDSLVVSTL